MHSKILYEKSLDKKLIIYLGKSFSLRPNA